MQIKWFPTWTRTYWALSRAVFRARGGIDAVATTRRLCLISRKAFEPKA